MKYLVTGGSGFIGSALVRSLVNDGAKVRVFDNNCRGDLSRLAAISDRVEMVEGDICDADAVAEAIRGTDYVCHLAYINGTEFFYEKPELVLEVAVKGMMNVIDGCLKHSVRKFLQMSSSEVYQRPPLIPTPENVPLVVPDPLNPRYSYGGGKIICELIALNYGRKFFDKMVIVRPHNVYGPDMGWEHVISQFCVRAKELIENNKGQNEIPFPIQGSGQETRAFVFIEDFIAGTRLVMDSGEHLGTYHVGTMDEVPISELARLLGQYYGVNFQLSSGSLQVGSVERRCPNIEKVMKLGYRPKTQLSEGLKTTADWYHKFAHQKKRGLRYDK